MEQYFSVWTMIRTSGFLAFFFLTLSLAFGLLSSLSLMKKKKALMTQLHQTSGWWGLLTIIFHISLIWQDLYVPYSLGEILIPFYAKNEPIFSALGTISFYLFFMVVASSDFLIKKLGIKLWKRLHLAVIPAWVFMIAHGILIGTDSSEPWVLLLYAGASSVIIILSFIRYLDSRQNQRERDARIHLRDREVKQR